MPSFERQAESGLADMNKRKIGWHYDLYAELREHVCYKTININTI